jgi:hypothetical protein
MLKFQSQMLEVFISFSHKSFNDLEIFNFPSSDHDYHDFSFLSLNNPKSLWLALQFESQDLTDLRLGSAEMAEKTKTLTEIKSMNS